MVVNFVDFEKSSATIPDLILTLLQVTLDFLDLESKYSNLKLNSSSDFGFFHAKVIYYLV